MILAIVGAVLLALGLFAGAVLVLVPLGVPLLQGSMSLWLIFPVFSVTGYLMFATGAAVAHTRTLALAVSCILLLLALVSAGALVADATALWPLQQGSGGLWYMLLLGGALGASGAAAHARMAPPDAAR